MRCMMYDIIVFENDKPAFSKKPTLVTIFGNLFFSFFSSDGGGRAGIRKTQFMRRKSIQQPP